MEEFDQGTLQHLSLSSDGRLSVAPRLREIYDSSTAVLWSIARDSKGNIYTGGGSLGGSRAKLFVIDSQGDLQGRGKLLAELDGIAVQAIAIDRQDRVYAATSPDGKVYRVDPSGKADVFYDPKTKYIWALAFAKNGDLYVATGDRGEIHRVTPAGVGSVFFRTEEAHARSMTVDSADNLIVGTEPSGLIMRVTPANGAGQGFVLYQAPKREITAVAVGADGAIYAAGAGNRTTAPVAAPASVGAPPVPAPQTPPPPGTVQIVGPSPIPVALPILSSQAVAGGSEIYRIQSDGYPRRIWSHAQDLVYALAFDAQGRLLAGTGNQEICTGSTTIIRTPIAQRGADADHGTAARAGRPAVCGTGNIGKVVAIGPELEPSGTFESDVLDAGGFSYWGHVGKEPGLRTERCSKLAPAMSAARSETGARGFLSIRAAWLPRPRAFCNFAQHSRDDRERRIVRRGRGIPDEKRGSGCRAGGNHAVELSLPCCGRHLRTTAPSPTLILPAMALSTTRRPAQSPAVSSDPGTPALTFDKGQIGARWLAEDDNGDALVFKVEIRGVNEKAWNVLRDKVRERYLSWDSTAYADGKYVLRVTASDAPVESTRPGFDRRTRERSVPDRQHSARDYLGAIRIAAVSRERRVKHAG